MNHTELDPVTCSAIWVKAITHWLKLEGNSISTLFKVQINGMYEDATKERLKPELAALALAAEVAMVYVRVTGLRTIDNIVSDQGTWANLINLIGESLNPKNREKALEDVIRLIAETPDGPSIKNISAGNGPK